VFDPEGQEEMPGRLEFRGANDGMDRIAFRRYPHEGGLTTAYYSMDLEPATTDSDALFLVAFSTAAGDDRGKQFLDGEGYFGAFAVGFKGNGQGGMDLVLRYRDANLAYTDNVLKADVQAGEKFRIVCRVDWDTVPPLSNPREALTVWVNPGEQAENAESSEFTAYAGDAASNNTVYLLQRRFGGTLADAVYVDNLRVADSFPE
jgi:hypothetical protein